MRKFLLVNISLIFPAKTVFNGWLESRNLKAVNGKGGFRLICWTSSVKMDENIVPLKTLVLHWVMSSYCFYKNVPQKYLGGPMVLFVQKRKIDACLPFPSKKYHLFAGNSSMENWGQFVPCVFLTHIFLFALLLTDGKTFKRKQRFWS